MNIKIVSASVRDGRNSHRVALYFRNYLLENNLATAEILDLREFAFPLFEERLQFMTNPPAKAVEFSEKIKAADAVMIVTPEYNGGYPASLKNAIDLLHPEWKKKPVAITTVSDGPFAGTQVITSLLFSMWKIGAWVIASMFPVPKVTEHYAEDGTPVNKAGSDKRAKTFVGELLWAAEATKKMGS